MILLKNKKKRFPDDIEELVEALKIYKAENKLKILKPKNPDV